MATGAKLMLAVILLFMSFGTAGEFPPALERLEALRVGSK